ncbi:MAG: carboxypeptidase-like regulatory domain-containing protein [Aquabacterium sp.]
MTDASGAVVPGATITATHVQTGVENKRQSTDAGLFVVAPLPPGAYQVNISASGFRPYLQKEVIIDALGTVEMTVKLEVGATSDSVTVNDTPPELNTADPRMGQTVRNEMYTALPLAMGGGSPRNPAAFIYLMPGVQEGGTFGFINGGQSFLGRLHRGSAGDRCRSPG